MVGWAGARDEGESNGMRECAICAYLGLEPRLTTSTVGLNTAIEPLIAAALECDRAAGSGEFHVLVAVCPEHVVDIYRERIPGMSMAWKLAIPNR